MPRILVTGASGILGSHICEAAHQAGYEVHALIRKTSSRRWLGHDWLTVHVVELDDPAGLREVLEGMDAVIHNAGVTSGSSPESCRKVNVEGTMTIAQASVEVGVRRFVFVSSRSAAGPNKKLFIRTEDDPDCPIEAYGQSKKKAEELLYALRDRLELVSLRYALLYGPRDTHLLPIFKMLSSPLHPIAGLRAIYTPLLYVKDAARAAVCAASADAASFQSGSVYYVSDGIPYSLETMYDLILSSAGKRSLRIRIPLWMVGLAAWFAHSVLKKKTGFTPDSVRELRSGSRLVSPARFMQDFGWRPQVLPHEAFAITVRWYREHGWIG